MPAPIIGDADDPLALDPRIAYFLRDTAAVLCPLCATRAYGLDITADPPRPAVPADDGNAIYASAWHGYSLVAGLLECSRCGAYLARCEGCLEVGRLMVVEEDDPYPYSGPDDEPEPDDDDAFGDDCRCYDCDVRYVAADDPIAQGVPA